MRNFVKSLMNDERGQQSTKRFLAIFGTIILSLTLILSLFSNKTLNEGNQLVSAIETIIIVCITTTTIDKFSNRKPSSETNSDTSESQEAN